MPSYLNSYQMTQPVVIFNLFMYNLREVGIGIILLPVPYVKTCSLYNSILPYFVYIMHLFIQVQNPLVPQNTCIFESFLFCFLKTTLSVVIHFILKVSLAM